LEAIALIEQFTSGMDIEAFRANALVVAAVERKLQIISEAANRLADEAERVCPGVPWRDVRGLGNQLRHAYERIDLATIWKTVIEDLPALNASVKHAMNRTWDPEG
jgi:uncharacterized protein with HEPN domain